MIIRTSYLIQGMICAAITAEAILDHSFLGAMVGSAATFYGLAKYLSPVKYGDE